MPHKSPAIFSVWLRAGLLFLSLGIAHAQAQNEDTVSPFPQTAEAQARPAKIEDFSESELVIASAKYLGTTAESMAEIVDNIFSRYGQPSAIIRGEEVSVAIMLGFRYGRGVLQFANGEEVPIYWRGPSIGVDTGGNAAKSFTLVYGANSAEDLHKRFGGIDGSAFYLGGVAVNYLQRGGVVVTPMRAGVGLRLGVSLGYLKFAPEGGWMPF
ncbi:MAG: EipA family protein [Parvibaculales bacterium]